MTTPIRLKELNSEILRIIQDAIDNALQPLATEFGVRLKCKGGSFTHSNATLKLEVATFTPDGAPVTKERQNWKLYAGIYGLNPDMLDKVISHGGKQYRIAGFNPKCVRFPVIAQRLIDSKNFKLPITDQMRAPKAASSSVIPAAPAPASEDPKLPAELIIAELGKLNIQAQLVNGFIRIEENDGAVQLFSFTPHGRLEWLADGQEKGRPFPISVKDNPRDIALSISKLVDSTVAPLKP